MKIIKALSKKVEEEISDAKEYVKMAIKYKDEYPHLSQTLYDISLQEMEHMALLHEEIAKIITAYREENGEPPAEMLAVYNYLHEEQISKARKVKTMQSMYGG